MEGLTARDVRWLWLACRLAEDLWDDELWYELATRALRVARETGALRVLPTAATYRACLHVHAGAFDAASSLIEEADAIVDATGLAPLKLASVMLAAWRGNEAEALGLLEAGLPRARARGEGMALGVADWATALLYNGQGRYAEALAAAQRACEYDDVGPFAWALVEQIEAGVRSGVTDAASAALDRLSARTQASGTDWALGIEAGSRALLSDGRDAEPLYREAVERLARSRGVVHLARARLLYGEWLRRENRRVDAREQLRAAYDRFSQIGAEAFAERARRELLATGETAPRRTVETRDVLTPQEAQIARMASDRQTNPEIGAKLFISPRTVEYHLRKVFTKLDISSRKELRGALAGIPDPAVSPLASSRGPRRADVAVSPALAGRSCHDWRRCPVLGAARPIDATARLGSPNRKDLRHAAHDRSRPRRLRRVCELGRRHRSPDERRSPRDRRRQPAAGLASDAAAVSDLVRTIDGPVVLVAHSYGGAVITNVAADAGEIVGLVYVNGFAPEPGESAFTLAGKFPGSMLGEATVRPVPRSDGTTDLYIDTDRFHDMFCPDVPAPQAAVMAATQRPATAEALYEPSGERPLWRELPSWFVFGELDRIIPAEVQHFMAKRAQAHRTIEIPGASHAVPVAHPDATAHLILEAASLHVAA